MLSMIWEKQETKEFEKKRGAISKECHKDVLHIRTYIYIYIYIYICQFYRYITYLRHYAIWEKTRN